MNKKPTTKPTELRAITERMLEAFCTGGGIVDDCGCGVVHVYTVGNSGNFDEGELEIYEAKAKSSPDKYIFHDYSSSSAGHIAGNKFVMDCPCLENRFGRYADFIWDNRLEIIDFLKEENGIRHDAVSATDAALAPSSRMSNDHP